jgi:hypothetical protein
MYDITLQNTNDYWPNLLLRWKSSNYPDRWRLSEELGQWFKDYVKTAVNPYLNFIGQVLILRGDYREESMCDPYRLEFIGPRLTIQLLFVKRISRCGVEVQITRTHEWEQFRSAFFVEREDDVADIKEMVALHTDRAHRLMLLSRKFKV